MNAPIQVGARRTSADIAVQVIGRIINLALGVVVTAVIVRALGAKGFGEWSAIFAVSQIAGNFGELGLSQIAVSRAAGDPARESQWLGALLSLRLVLAIPVTIASAVAVVLIASTHQSRLAGVLISLALLVEAPSCLSTVFQLRVRNDITMAIMTLNSVLWAAAVFTIASVSASIFAFATAFLAVSVLTTTVTVVVAVRMRPVSFHAARRLWRGLASIGLAVGAAGILVTFYVRLDQILVLEFAGSREAGLYGAAYRILDQVQFIPISVMTTLFPLIASSYTHDVARVRALLQVAAEYLTIASLPILAFTIVAADPIIHLLFGSRFLAAVPALPILMGAFVSISFGYLAGNMVVILQLQRRFLLYTAIGLAINAALNVVLIPRYGFLAAAWVTLATEITVMGLTMHSVLRALEMRPRVSRFARTVLAAALMGLCTWLAREAAIPLSGLIAIAAVSYALAVAALRLVSPAEVRASLQGTSLPSG